MKFVMVFFVLVASSLASGQIYRWVDENGKTHFGDKKQEALVQEEVVLDKHTSEWKKYVININDVDEIMTSDELKRIEKDVNVVYRFFDEKLYFDIYKTVPVTIRLYELQEDYHSYLDSIGASNSKKSRGIYNRKTNEIVVFLNQQDRWRTFWTIKHETAHAVVDTLTPFVPAWLNEGVAENMEAIEVSGERFFLAPHHENFSSIRYAIQQKQDLQVDQLLSMPSRDYYQNVKAGYNPNQPFAGELVRMLLSSVSGVNFLTRIIHSYERGDRTFSSYLVDKHYVGGKVVLQNNWNRWMNRDKSIQCNL
ncbi:MAG: DUF4124 domain-containing protein [Agarilytica sp.]